MQGCHPPQGRTGGTEWIDVRTRFLIVIRTMRMRTAADERTCGDGQTDATISFSFVFESRHARPLAQNTAAADSDRPKT